MPQRTLTALPVYNEAAHVGPVLAEVRRHAPGDVLAVDDGSTDGTAEILAAVHGVRTLRHPRNRGYGAALRTAFAFALRHGYDVLVTIDCDGQHEPQRIGRFVAAAETAQIVSGSRYLERFAGDTPAPEDRRRINRTITAELNRLLRLRLTDAFCGFKAYRAEALARLAPTEDGYAMPLEVWVQAAAAGLSIVELPVPLVYLDEKRSFGGSLDDAARRLAHYREVIARSLAAVRAPAGVSRGAALCGEPAE
jgi:dolichol-phosphate mannosyltransferase